MSEARATSGGANTHDPISVGTSAEDFAAATPGGYHATGGMKENQLQIKIRF
jgi:hypothetical protein